jgi:sugar lactone lactonase YvrE
MAEPSPDPDPGPSEAVACSVAPTQLGEGVRWDARRGGELLRVDILAGRVFRERVAADGDLVPVDAYDLPGTVGAVAPIDGDDGWLLAADQGFVHLRPDGSHRTIADVAPPGTRMNDAACDPSGRFWAGTLADDHHVGGGALYRLDPDGRCETVLEGLTISNGLGWSPDARTMYLVDSGPRVVYAFAYDPASGAISDQRVVVALDEAEGAPDGMTVDAAGDLWVAVYGGGCVRRYAPDGEPRQELRVPAVQATCCGFAGVGLSRLYVTTATEGWTDEQRRADPAAGLVYRFDTDTTGRPAQPFQPAPRWWEEITGP